MTSAILVFDLVPPSAPSYFLGEMLATMAVVLIFGPLVVLVMRRGRKGRPS